MGTPEDVAAEQFYTPPEQPANPVNTAVITIHPENDAAITKLYDEGLRLKQYAEARVITVDADLKVAVEDLATVANLKKALEERKKEWRAPVAAHLKAIDQTFTTMVAPFEDATLITKGKIISYRQEQERKRVEAEAINREKMNLARREAALKDGEITVDLTQLPVPPPHAARVRTDIGMAGIATIWKWELVDFSKVQDKHKVLNEALIGKLVRAGERDIPGIRIYPEESVRVTTR